MFLHIGIEKTGSTTLQAVGSANRELLRKRGILYPSTPGLKNHTGLAVYASSGKTVKDIRKIVGLSSDQEFLAFQDRFPEQLRREIEESGCQRIWLSNEHLSSRVRKPSEILRLAKLARALADDVRVIVYIRNQPDLFISHYSTSVRSGSVRDITLPRSEKDYFFNFALLLQRWASIWGKDALDVRIFDRALLKDGDITADFFQAIGESLDGAILLPAALNPSLDAHALQFLRLFNAHITRLTEGGLNPEYGQIASLLAEASKGPKFSLPASVMQQVERMFASSNSFVAEKYFQGRQNPLFPLRAYPESTSSQTLNLADAQALGTATLSALDMQIKKSESHVTRSAKQALSVSVHQDKDIVAQSDTVEHVVATTAILWRERQLRLQQLRAIIRNSS